MPLRLLFPLISIILAGCGSRTGSFVPSESNARDALEMVLTAWKDAQGPEGLTAGGKGVRVVVARWQTGGKLQDFTILGSEAGDGANKPVYFKVRLRLETSPIEEETRFVILGNDPVWVFEEADYKRL